jgi:hypothetical protein
MSQASTGNAVEPPERFAVDQQAIEGVQNVGQLRKVMQFGSYDG